MSTDSQTSVTHTPLPLPIFSIDASGRPSGPIPSSVKKATAAIRDITERLRNAPFVMIQTDMRIRIFECFDHIADALDALDRCTDTLAEDIHSIKSDVEGDGK